MSGRLSIGLCCIHLSMSSLFRAVAVVGREQSKGGENSVCLCDCLLGGGGNLTSRYRGVKSFALSLGTPDLTDRKLMELR